MRTSRANVYAIGECAEIQGQTFSLVETVQAQATQLAKTLVGEPTDWHARVYGTHLKMRDVDLFAVGDTAQASHQDAVVEDSHHGIYRRLFFSGQHLIGSVLFGNTSASRRITESIGTALNIRERESLLFGNT